MAKTQLTKNIEKALAQYRPNKLGELHLNYMRKQYMEFEVPVTHSSIKDGLVDAIWVAEGFIDRHEERCCRYPHHFHTNYMPSVERLCEKDFTSIDKNAHIPCDKKDCWYNSPIICQKEVTPVICFEIKISKTDFHSNHGHNFVGNLNYYVMPYELYKEVRSEVPDDIGCITYHSKDINEIGKLRHQEPSRYVNLFDNNLYVSVLHTVLNKKDKQLEKVRYKCRSLLDKQQSISGNIIRELCDTIKFMLPKPECYETYWNNCKNQDSHNDKCDACYYGNMMYYKYLSKLNDESPTAYEVLE